MAHVKIWLYNNEIYEKISEGWVFCILLEHQNGDPVDVGVTESWEEAVTFFLNANGQPYPIIFEVPEQLPYILDVVNADFLNPEKVKHIETSTIDRSGVFPLLGH